MVFYVKTPKRELWINEIYLMLSAFLISYLVTEIVKKVVIKRRKSKQNKQKNNIKIPNPRGGGMDDMLDKFSRFKFQVTDDKELAYTILACIADAHRYILKDEYLTKVIFSLVQAIVKDQSIILSPNMLRFLALHLLRNKDNNLQITFGNIFMESMNRGRILLRIVGSLVMGATASLFTTFYYSLMTTIIYFELTQNIGFRCSQYFEQLPAPANHVLLEGKKPRILVADTKSGNELTVYSPKSSRRTKEVHVVTKNELVTERRYKRHRRQPNEIRFIDFQKSDPVLARFRDQDLDEPYVPQDTPPGKAVQNLIDSTLD